MSIEEDVGIERYANDGGGFTGILRHRYTDFKVNEIDLDGQVVALTHLEAPPTEHRQPPAIADGEAALQEAPTTVAALVGAYGSLAGQEAPSLASLTEFLAQAAALKANASSPAPGPITLGPLEDKQQRRAAHALFKALPWLPPLRTETVEGPGGELQCLRIAVDASSSGGGGGRGQKRKREEWAGGAARYVRFALYKENMDTHHALSTLATALHCNTKVFAVAGTKDKRAVTVQRVTAFQVAPARLAALNARLRGLRVGDFEFAEQQLGLGDLQGNRFDIVLRGISAESAEAVTAAAEALRGSGFINYFGLQRFGSSDVPTHRVGAALMRGHWAEAIRHIMAPGRNAWPEVAQACAAYLDRGDAKAALHAMPRHLVAERAILGVLAREGPTALVNALMAVPRNLRTIYLHAYQSFLWNAAASARVAEHGAAAAVAGDLVLPLAEMRQARVRRAAEYSSSRARNGAGGESGKSGEGDVLEAAAEGEDVVDGAAAAGSGEVRVVTEDEAAAGRYGIEDVVLPLPGQSVRYPSHSTAEVYRRIAERDGVELDRSVHSVSEFSLAKLPGAYRHLLHRPADLQYEVVRYDDHNAELALTRLQELEGRAPPLRAAEGKFLALRLQFSLPSSCYATMLVRELTKMPTDTAFAKSLQHPL